MIVNAVKSFGARLQAVGLLPTLLAVAFVAFLLVAKAPTASMSLKTITATAKAIGGSGAVVITGIAIAVAVTLQPLQFRLVQILEGYWPSGPLRMLFRVGVRVQRWRYERLQDQLTGAVNHRHEAARRSSEERISVAETRILERFPDEDRLLPTALGNALRSAEDRAGRRYGAEAVVLWPRLFPLLPARLRADIEDEVTQLDVSARLAVTWATTAVISSTIVLLHPVKAADNWGWVAIVAAVWLLAWLSYQSAIESAIAHGLDIEVALDLHRSLVVSAMRLPEPARLSSEQRVLTMLCRLYRTYDEDHKIELHFVSKSQGT